MPQQPKSQRRQTNRKWPFRNQQVRESLRSDLQQCSPSSSLDDNQQLQRGIEREDLVRALSAPPRGGTALHKYDVRCFR